VEVPVRHVTGPGLPSPTGSLSTVVTGMIAPAMLLMKTSSALRTSSAETVRASSGMPSSAASSMTVLRVMPSKSSRGVRRLRGYLEAVTLRSSDVARDDLQGVEVRV
jgi:hypothetical protein